MSDDEASNDGAEIPTKTCTHARGVDDAPGNAPSTSPICVVGIDPSLSGFAVGVGTCDGVELHETRTKPTGERASKKRGAMMVLADRMARIEGIGQSALGPVGWGGVSVAFIEAYAFSVSNVSATECAAIMRWKLWKLGVPIIEVSPSALKKWATGKGNADKGLVISHLSQRYERVFDSDNTADAFALTEMARQVVGLSAPQTAFQREAITKVAPMSLGGLVAGAGVAA